MQGHHTLSLALAYHPLVDLTPFSVATAGWVVRKLDRKRGSARKNIQSFQIPLKCKNSLTFTSRIEHWVASVDTQHFYFSFCGQVNNKINLKKRSFKALPAQQSIFCVVYLLLLPFKFPHSNIPRLSPGCPLCCQPRLRLWDTTWTHLLAMSRIS